MRERIEDTPPPSPGFGNNDDDGDEMFEDEIAEEIDVIEGEAEAGEPLILFQRKYFQMYRVGR